MQFLQVSQLCEKKKKQWSSTPQAWHININAVPLCLKTEDDLIRDYLKKSLVVLIESWINNKEIVTIRKLYSLIPTKTIFKTII